MCHNDVLRAVEIGTVIASVEDSRHEERDMRILLVTVNKESVAATDL